MPTDRLKKGPQWIRKWAWGAQVNLAIYVDIEPKELIFEYGPQNKPTLSESHGEHRVSFNLSHSHKLALIAVTNIPRRIGVDLELILEPKPNAAVKRYFSETEQKTLNSIPSEKQQRAFFNLWSRKEAFVKALGEGIHLFKMNQLAVTFSDDLPAKIQTVPESCAPTQNWFMENLNVGPEYACCIVAELLSTRRKAFGQKL